MAVDLLERDSFLLTLNDLLVQAGEGRGRVALISGEAGIGKTSLVERTFPDGLQIPLTEEGATNCRTVVATNTDDLVTWVHSYVTEDKSKTFCIYDAPSPRGDPPRRASQ